MVLTVLVAILVPIAFLYVIHWLDLYGSDRPRIVLLCFAWGLVAFGLSFLANRFCIDVLGLPRSYVGTRTAPFVEESFKALVLFYLLRRSRLNYIVDGAVYGFAAGIGFAVIENVRYVQLFPDNPLALVVVRDFSSALAHGTATALTGIALGGLAVSGRVRRGVPILVLSMAAGMALHYVWNIFSFFSTLGRFATEWILVGVGLTGMALVATAILWGLRRERAQLRDALDLKIGVSRGEANMVQHLGDLDDLLAPIERRFGTIKRRHVADFLHLEAQLGLTRRLERSAIEPGLRARLASEVRELEQRLNAQRREVGVYVMLYVRAILPTTTWSLWARLGQWLAQGRPSGARPWAGLAARLPSPQPLAPGEDVYARLQGELHARTQARTLTMWQVSELPEAMRKCMHWAMREMVVTAQHAAVGLGHPQAHAHQLLDDLADRGFLHRTTTGGRAAFRACVIADDGHAARPHIWRSLMRCSDHS